MDTGDWCHKLENTFDGEKVIIIKNAAARFTAYFSLILFLN